MLLLERVTLKRNCNRRYSGKTYNVSSKRTVHHLYLCDKHWPELYDFMEAYEGR